MVKRFGKRAAARIARTIGWRRAKHEAQALATASTLLTWGTEGHGDTDPTLPLVRKASPEAVPCRTLRVYFIKPSKYDEQGYVLRFWKGVLPNNTLTALAQRSLQSPARDPERVCRDRAVGRARGRRDQWRHYPGDHRQSHRRRSRGPDRPSWRANQPVSARPGPGIAVRGRWFSGDHGRLPRQRVPRVVHVSQQLWGNHCGGRGRKHLGGAAGRLRARRAAVTLQRHLRHPRQDRHGRDPGAVDHRCAIAGDRRALSHALRQYHHDYARHLAWLPIHLLVLQCEERYGPDDARA